MKTLAECQAATPGQKLWTIDDVLSDHVFVWRRPKPLEWRAYRAAAYSAKMSSMGEGSADGLGLLDAFEALAIACVVSHTPSELFAIIEPPNGTDDGYLELYEAIGTRIAAQVSADMEKRAKKTGPALTKP